MAFMALMALMAFIAFMAFMALMALMAFICRHLPSFAVICHHLLGSWDYASPGVIGLYYKAILFFLKSRQFGR